MNQSAISGLIAGLVAGCVGTVRAAMYSYNGVILPALPEWDRERYPYAAIGYSEHFGLYTLSIKETVWTAREAGTVILNAFHYYGISDDGTAWVENGGVTAPQTPVWANHNIYYADDTTQAGTLRIAASDPIPV